MRFELINPSDPYTFEAEDLEVAAVAVCLLGEGAYMARATCEGAKPEHDVPAFLLGGQDDWFRKRFGVGFEASLVRMLERRAPALARALESVTLQRQSRSSLNDIGAKARKLAASVLEAGGG